MIIDAHAHAAREYSTVESIQEMAKKYAIEKIVLCTSPKNNQNLKEPPNIPFMKTPSSIYLLNRLLRFSFNSFFKDNGDGNQYVFELKKKLPESVIQFLWVNPLDPQHMRNLDQNILEYQVKGIKLHQAWDPFTIGGCEFSQLVDVARAHRLPIFIHLYSINETWKLSQFMDHNLDVIFIIGHMLGLDIFKERQNKSPNLYFDTSGSERVRGKDILDAVNLFGHEHVIFGSDTPYAKIGDQIEKIDRLHLSENVKEHIYRLNIAPILDIDAHHGLKFSLDWSLEKDDQLTALGKHHSDNNPEKNTNWPNQSSFRDRLQHLPADRLAWLWLVVGFSFLPFTFFQTVIPLAAWLAPIFLLRFERTARRAWVALLMIFLAYAVGIEIALRGSISSDMTLNIIGLINFPLLKGLIFTLPYAADRWIGSQLPAWARLLVFPFAFTTMDWLMSRSAFINSTGSPAYSQYDNLALMQILSITGMWGITFLIMWCATTVNALWEHRFEWRAIRYPLGAFTFTMLAVLLFGNARLAFSPPTVQTVEAGTITIDSAITSRANSSITGNLYQATDAQRAAIRLQLAPTIDQMLTRTETALRGGAKIVSWQEGAGIVLEEDEQITLNRVGMLAKQYDAYIQVSLGVITRGRDQHFIRNQSILIDHTGAVRWTYDKTYLVYPIEQYIFIAGPGQLPIVDTPYGRLSSAICNDLHFTPLINQAGQKDVDILITPYHDVHPFELEDAVVATFRAVENGFSLVRPAGEGTSTIVDYQGRILASQNFFTNNTGIMLTTVPTRSVPTIYRIIGDSFAYLSVCGLVILFVWGLGYRKLAAAHQDPRSSR